MAKSRAQDVEIIEAAADDARKYRAPALEKGLDILELLARHGAPMTASQISAALDRSVSELFRMVQVLEFKGFIEPSANEDGYVLTNKLFTLGLAQAPMRTLVEAALPEMRALSEALVQSCHLVVPSEDQIVVIARIESPGVLGFSVRVGYRRPLIDTTSGSVLYAFQPEAVRTAWLERISESATKKKVAEFIARAKEHKEAGFARRESEFVQGVTDLAAPIKGATRAVATLVVPFVRQSPAVCTIGEALSRLRRAARRISEQASTDE